MPYRASRSAAGTCPRCRETLLPTRLSIERINETVWCEKCGGVFASLTASKRILETLDRTLLEIGFQAALGKARKKHDDRVLTCPECLMEMTKTWVEAAACQIDACPLHGTWFDTGELVDVLRAFAAARKRGVTFTREPPAPPVVPTAEDLWEPPSDWADEGGLRSLFAWLRS